MFTQPADRRISIEEYINIYKDDAIREMLSSGVPASVTLAQAILESDCGNSPLAKYANNHFGIKCHTWAGPSFYLDDDKRNECFRKYYSVVESYKDHSDFLKGKSRYAFLFQLRTTDYKGWCRGLKKAGYATNGHYADRLIRIIEDNDLNSFDHERKMPEKPFISKKEEKAVHVQHREIKVHENNIKYVIAREGDTYYKIAREFELGLWQIKKYNDLNKWDKISEGSIIYLQPKRCRAREKYYIVHKGDSMWNISQKFGVKLKSLYRKNNMIPGTQPHPGQKLSLKRKLVDS